MTIESVDIDHRIIRTWYTYLHHAEAVNDFDGSRGAREKEPVSKHDSQAGWGE